MRTLLLATVFLASIAFGDDVDARTKLVGAWQPAAEAAKDASTWTFQTKGDDVLHVTESQGDQKIMEFECSTTGRECEIQDSGKPAKVSMYFNGGRLVALETKGKDVVKRRFVVAAAGDALEVDVIPIVPDGKSVTLHLRRAQP